MADDTGTPRVPVVVVRDGKVFTDSRSVAEFFEKQHFHVLRDIDNLLKAEPELAASNFGCGHYTLPSTGSQQHRLYTMDRDGFTLLAMGFTGPKALRWKLKYIEAFNTMEAQIKQAPADMTSLLMDPSKLRGLLLSYTEKVTELQGRVEEMRPSVHALERIAISDGSMSITEAAKNLQAQPKDVFTWLRTKGWIYRRPGAQADLAYQTKLLAGLLEHKTTIVVTPEGREKTVTQVRVTPKGLTELAREMFPDRLV